MRGALGLIVIAAVIWAFWMTYEWLVNRNKKKNIKPNNEQ